MRHTPRSWLAATGLLGLSWLAGCGGGAGGSEAVPASPAPDGVRPPVVDSARVGSAPIGPAGGTVRTTAANGVEYTLTVPAHALKETLTIRMAPITDLGSTPLAPGLSGAVQFEPSGLQFLRPATLHIGALPVLGGSKRLLGFSSANDGTGTQLSLPVVRDGGIDIVVTHFSNAGAAAATPEEIATALAPNQDPGEVEFWAREIVLGDRLPATIGENFLSWFNGVVSPRLAAASGTDDSTLEALSAYETWINAIEATPSSFGFSPEAEAQMLALLATRIDQAKLLVSAILRAKLDADLAACQANPTTALVEFSSLMQQLAARYGLDTPAAGLDRAGFLRKANDCLRPVLDPVTLQGPLSGFQPRSLDLRAQVVLNGRPDPVGVPFEFSITPTAATVATPLGFSDAAGRFTTVFTPSSASPSFQVRACLVLNDANGLTGSDICASAELRTSLARPVGRFAGTYEITSRTPFDRACFNDLLQPPNQPGQTLFGTRTTSQTVLILDESGVFELNVDPGFGGGQWSSGLSFGADTLTGRQVSQSNPGLVLATFSGTFSDTEIMLFIDSPAGAAHCTSKFTGTKQ